MSLASGTRLGLYEITGHLGSGGMGVVYRARDTRLGREVAIKVLPDEMAADAERLARFEREARVLASLNHANVATLYGAETAEGAGFLVMELVEGETLAERIARGRLPFGEALPLFLQIAEGIEAAHAKGVIHRDLKPANIKLTTEGVPKILDFGLAKALAPEQSASGEAALSESPTLTLQATRRGEILGTAAYMSPEQARGLESDPRADVWGFGCCLFEALTGKRPFSGEDAAQTLASVLKDEPDWSALPAELPANVAMLLRRCLEKSRRARLQSIGDARLELAESIAPPPRFGPAPRTAAMGGGRARLWVTAAVALAALVAGLLAGMAASRRGPATGTVAEPTHLSVEVPADLDIRMANDENNLRISNDGRTLYVIGGRGSDRQIYTRRLNERSFRPVPGTAGLFDSAFMVSPDGEWVGFYRDRTLLKVRLEGGVPVPLFRGPNVWLPHWGDDGFIYFSAGAVSGLWRVPENGGEAEAVTELDTGKREYFHGSPLLLPGRTAVLFKVNIGSYDRGHLEVVFPATGERRVLGVGLARPLYASRTHLVYWMGHEVLAAPFDAENVRLTGPGIPVLADVESNEDGRNAIFALSQSGTLAYLPRRGIHQGRLAWKDRTGATEPVDWEAAHYGSLRLAPDGAGVALSRFMEPRSEILTLDLRRRIADAIASDSFRNDDPVLSPNGRAVAYSSDRGGGTYNLYAIDLDSGGEPAPIQQSPHIQVPQSWSSDGRFLAYRETTPAEDFDLWALPVDEPEGTRTPFPIANSSAEENHAAFSPDARWVAYNSERSGRREIYVARFDGEQRSVGRPQPVSSDGGWLPVWSRDGRELFFRNGNASAIMKVDILRTEPELELGSPAVLFEEREMFAKHWSAIDYDVAPDGRFLMLVQARPPEQTIHVVLDWLDELERLVPSK